MEVYRPAVEEEEDDEEEQWPETTNVCCRPFCQEAIPYGEDVVVITICSSGTTEAGLQYAPLPADDGDYLYEPVYFCADCWVQVESELHELTHDMPPVVDDQAAFACQVCGSGIRTGELFGVATLGQVITSQRCPDVAPTTSFQSMDNAPTMICIACMNILEKNIAEMWGGRIVQCTECEEGTFLRCWRHGCSADGNCQHAHPMEIVNGG